MQELKMHEFEQVNGGNDLITVASFAAAYIGNTVTGGAAIILGAAAQFVLSNPGQTGGLLYNNPNTNKL